MWSPSKSSERWEWKRQMLTTSAPNHTAISAQQKCIFPVSFHSKLYHHPPSSSESVKPWLLPQLHASPLLPDTPSEPWHFSSPHYPGIASLSSWVEFRNSSCSQRARGAAHIAHTERTLGTSCYGPWAPGTGTMGSLYSQSIDRGQTTENSSWWQKTQMPLNKMSKAACSGAHSPSPAFWPSLNPSNGFLWPKSPLLILTTGKNKKKKM